MPGYDRAAGLPEDSRLAQIARELDELQLPAALCDAAWNLVWVSRELKVLLDADDDELCLGSHVIEAYASPAWFDAITPDSRAELFVQFFPMVIEGTPGGKERVAAILERSRERWGSMSEGFD